MINRKFYPPITSSWIIYEDDIGVCGKTYQNFILQWLEDNSINTMNFTFKLDDRIQNYALNKIEIDFPIASKRYPEDIEEEILKLYHYGDSLVTPRNHSYSCDDVKFILTSNREGTTGTLQFSNFQFEAFTPNQKYTFAEPIKCVSEDKPTKKMESSTQLQERNVFQGESSSAQQSMLPPMILVTVLAIHVFQSTNNYK